LIQIKPQDFEKPSAQAIKDVVNDKYSNRIVPGIGLCLCMWDLVSATEGLIGHGTGLVNVNSKSNFPHQVICSHTQLSRIPHDRLPSFPRRNSLWTDKVFQRRRHHQNLPENSSFSKAEMVWIWNSEGTELFFDKGEPVLFRVEHEEWYDQRPTIVEKDEKGEIIEERPTAWKIIVS
jgi:DNA-directed RNA polymerase III subunit RPC8